MLYEVITPFFGVDKAEYENALEEVKPLLWRGYELGFVRTACWCCPFQKVEQWEKLKEHYPLLWEEMRRITSYNVCYTKLLRARCLRFAAPVTRTPRKTRFRLAARPLAGRG